MLSGIHFQAPGKTGLVNLSGQNDWNGAVAYAESSAACTGLVIWPHEKSDLSPDPDVKFGRFPNGLRYVLMHNKEPRNRVSAHLVIQAGSLNETDAERGLAHFLEHMMFNGTVHFPPGEMVKYFQRIGMQFGPDANAHTGFNETVYDVLLPLGDRKHLEEALVVLLDYAQGALLLPEEIERERKVVLAEKRTRDSADYRTMEASLNFDMPDTLLPKRLPIGVEPVIQNADRSLLKGFYDACYRPDNMIVVMVGDFDTEEAAGLIGEKFAQLTAHSPARQTPDLGRISHKGLNTFYHYEKESGKTTVTMERIKKVMPEPDSFDYQKRMLEKHMADRIVQNRLDKLVKKPDTPFTSADISSGIQLQEFFFADMMVQCRPENWENALSEMEKVLRKALQYGFTENETERVRKDLLAEMEKAEKGAATRNSRALAAEIIWNLDNDRVFQSPKQEKALFAPVVRSVTAARLHEALQDSWAPDSRLVLVTGNALIQPEANETIRAVYQKSQTVEVPKPKVTESARFPYLSPAKKPVEIVKQEDISDLGITVIDFQNGVRLNLKQTNFKDNELLAALRFGNGRSMEPEGREGLAVLAEAVLNESGTNTLDKEELAEALAGKITQVRFQIRDEAMELVGRSSPEEVELLFQLFQAYLQDTGFREDAYQVVKERFQQRYNTLQHSTDGAMELRGRRFLAGGDGRFGLPPYEILMKNSLEDVRQWIMAERAGMEIELSLSGDFDREKVISLAARYLGALSIPGSRKEKETSRNPGFPAGKSLSVDVPTDIPKGLVDVAYPTDDFWNIGRTRRLVILGEIVSEMMRVKIRENLGASYSSYAYNDASRVYQGYGVFHAMVQVAPEDADMVVKEIQRIADDIRKNGVGDDLFRRALDPVLTGLKDMLRTNSYWLNSVMLGMRQHPQQLEWSRSLLSDYAAITKEEVAAFAVQYLDNRKAVRIIIQPDKKNEKKPEVQ